MSSWHEAVDRQKEVLREAARWHLLARLFERPRPGWLDGMRALCTELSGEDRELAAAVRQATGVGEGQYLAVLGPGAPVSPREVAYRGWGDPGRILADVAGIYEAFAYRPKSEDPPDHVAVEAGFVGYLCLKESYALARRETEHAERVAQGRKAFVGEHLGTFAAKLARKLETASVPHLSLAAALLASWCGVPERAPELPIVGPTAPEVEGDEMSCAEVLPAISHPDRETGR